MTKTSLPALAALMAGGVAMLTACAAARAADSAQQLAMATEQARQRAACAAAGEQILAGNVIRAAVYQEQFSRYSLRTGRCYVEMRVQTLAVDEHADRTGRFLYDGQTEELLAFAEIRNGTKSGRVFDLSHRTRSFANGGFDDASSYISEVMAADR